MFKENALASYVTPHPFKGFYHHDYNYEYCYITYRAYKSNLDLNCYFILKCGNSWRDTWKYFNDAKVVFDFPCVFNHSYDMGLLFLSIYSCKHITDNIQSICR